jgi:hypothetical protein
VVTTSLVIDGRLKLATARQTQMGTQAATRKTASTTQPSLPGQRGVGESAPPFFQKLGPGLVTGASDDDPSGIGTYSQVGAQFGYGMLWIMVLSYPLMFAIQVCYVEVAIRDRHH